MPDLKISQLPVASTPLAGTELVPIVQGGTTDQTTVQAIMTSTVPSGTANGVLYLNGSKVATSGSALVFDGSNLGLGVTPSVGWTSANSQRAAQIGPVGSISSLDGGASNRQFSISNNAINFNSTPTYFVSDFATSYRTAAGQHQWLIAPSGTAGNTISFTQAMTLNASGNLGVGITNPANRIDVREDVNYPLSWGSTSAISGILSYASGVAIIGGVTSTALGLWAGNSEKARITAAGNQISTQPVESAQNTSVTLTVANLQARIITSNAAVTLTLPTGTTLDTYATNMAVDMAFECTFIATTANAITIAANGNTTVGSLTVAGNTSGTFRFRKTAANTFTVYRVA